MCPGIHGEGDEDHFILVQFANDIITGDERCGGGGGFVCMSNFALLMMLKVAICISSDCVENVFRLGGLECRWEPGDVDVCPNGGVGTVVVRCGIRRERYVKRLCCGVRAEMGQWFDSHGSVRVEIICLCQNRR